MPSPSPSRSASRAPRVDAALAAAVELAREAAVETGGESVGEHLGVRAEGERLATHAFAADLPGYRGWHWSVTLARAPRAKVVTVDEVVLLPGDGAVLAPAWVPWSERVQAGDLRPGDLLPAAPDDPRLVPAYAEETGLNRPEPEIAQEREVAWELGLGRARVLSRFGREDAAARWADGDGGPDTPMAKQAPGPCGTCGFYLPLSGSLAVMVGVCGNEVTDTDGRVVTADHGCGAHSEAAAAAEDLAHQAEVVAVVFDDGEVMV
ncbi:DUF3027 domain-containing protein [Jatrophihabitans sp. YIM 134969]